LVSQATAYVLLVITMALWGGALVIARGIAVLAPPMGVTFWRWLIALLILLPFVWRKLPALMAKQRSIFALLPLSCFMVIGTTLSVAAVNYTTAINATIINAAQAAMTAVVAFVLLRERLIPRQILGVVLAFSGILVMVFKGDWALLLSVDVNWGDVLMLGAIIAWARYAVGIHRATDLPDGDVLLFYIAVVAVVSLLPLYIFEAIYVREINPTPLAIAGIAYLAVGSTVLAIILWNLAIRSVGASRAGMFVNLIPVFGAIFAMMFLGERLYQYHIVGALFVAVGIVMAVRQTRSTAARVSESGAQDT
jgi:drug/metabolite transporter (DMT)-like permease